MPMLVSGLHLAAFAACPELPGAAHGPLVSGADLLTRRTLARRCDLDERVRLELIEDPDPTTRRLAVAGVRDPGVLGDLAEMGVATVNAGLAANPHTPVAILDEFAAHGPLRKPHPPARVALANPSTSHDVVLARVKAAKLGDVVSREVEAARSMHAARILNAHPCVAQVWADTHDPVVVRAVASRPDITPAVAERIASRDGQLGMRTLARNPFVPDATLAGRFADARAGVRQLLEGQDPRVACGDPGQQPALAALGSPTLDLLLADPGADLTAKARAVLFARVRPQLEPNVLARLLGAADIDETVAVVARLAITRMRAAATEVPMLTVALAGKPTPFVLPSTAALAEACSALGESPQRWHAFVSMAHRERGTLEDLVTVAVGVAA